MTVNIGLITSAAITQDELSAFVRDLGGEVSTNKSRAEPLPDTGHLQHEGAYLWIHLYPENLNEVLRDNGEAVVSKLGAMAHTWVDVNLSSDEGSDRLALKFAAAFMARWPAILDDCCGGLHSRDELLQFQASRQPLWKVREASLNQLLQNRD